MKSKVDFVSRETREEYFKKFFTAIDETKRSVCVLNHNNIILKSSETHSFKVCFVQFSNEATKFTAKKPHK